MSLQQFSEKDWLGKIYRKSESARTEACAKVSLRMFDAFCKHEGTSKEKMILEYQELVKEGDVRNICLSLDKFVQFLNLDHDEIKVNEKDTFKKKNPKTIKTYFSFIKSYLRICHAVKISTEDIRDYVTFPKLMKVPRIAIPLKTLKLIFNNASPQRRALYYTLISSGMRLGEGLALTKKDFHLDENPIRITIPAEITKTREGRETYISSEAFEKLKPIFETKKDNEKIFTHLEELGKAVILEEHIFHLLREKLDLLEKYPNSNRYVVNIHSFRAYFHTKASQKHGSDYANALDGHGAYLKQYYRETPEERAKKYKQLEPSLFIESFKLETEKTKDRLISSLQEEMKKLQDKMIRLELLNTP